MTALVAHRGAHGPPGSGEALENTLEAFEQAILEGADMVELDVWRCADGGLFVHHDERLPGGALLTELDTPAVRATRLEGGARLPSLEEALDLMRGRVAINIELKHAPATAPTLALVRAFGLQSQVVLSSFVHQALALGRRLAPGVARALVSGTDTLDPAVRFVESFPFWVLRELDAAFWHPHLLLVHPALIRALHRHGVRVNVWTVNDVAAAHMLSRGGVDGLITDHPGALRAGLFG